MIGVDCVDIERFESDNFKSKRFLKKIYTDAEIDYCKARHPSSQHFAVRFAAKEAIIKALSPSSKLNLKNIEIRNLDGKPHAFLDNNRLDVEISLSHSQKVAIAVAISFNK